MEIETLLFNDFKDSLKKSVLTNTLTSQMDLLIKRYGAEYTSLAEKILVLMNKMQYDSQYISGVYIYDYLIQLDYFVENNSYGHKNYENIKEEIYDNSDVMLNTYMPGLFISYICTTVLYEKYHLYLNKFLLHLTNKSQGVEIGFGEGFYLWNLYENSPGIKLRGYDISPYAKVFAEKLFEAACIPSNDYDLRQGNIIGGLEIEEQSLDYAILAEVIEHLPEAVRGIQEVARILKPKGLLYLSTVIDSNHMDHLVNFQSSYEIEEMLRENEFIVIDKLNYKVQDDYPKSKDKSQGLAYICKRL